MTDMETTFGAEALATNAQPMGPAEYVALFIMAAAAVFLLASFWKIFTKAGQPGWAILVPIYNVVTLMRVAGKPGWWFLLLLIPGVNAIVLLLTWLGVSKNFGKGSGFGLGMWLLPPLFAPILGFGNARYQPAA